MNKIKKEPLRKCLGTDRRFPKKDLIRIVRTPEGRIIIDEKGKANGRGAYVSRSEEALAIVRKKKLLEKHLNSEIPSEIFERLAEMIGEKDER